jgi:hypothetical protein
MIAYEITNTITGKRYIGITRRSLLNRWKEHVKRAKESRPTESILINAIRKYGPEYFIAREIACAKTWTQMQEVERGLILQEATSRPHGYNLTPGGDGGPTMSGRRLTAQQSAKLSVAKLQTWASFTPERRAAIGTKISNSKMGQGKGVVRGPNKGRGVPKSPEHRARLAEGNRRRAAENGFGAMISAALRASPKTAAYNLRRIGAKRGPYRTSTTSMEETT